MNNNNEPIEIVKQHLLTDENFAKLKQSQSRIFDATSISPSIRILLNHIITKESLDNVEEQLILQLKQISQ